MADKSSQLVLDALGRSAAEPGGLPLHGTKASPGLFAGNAQGKQAAQHCKDEGFLQVLRSETRGKTVHEIYAISEKGLAYLLDQVNPRQVLENFVHALDARRHQLDDLLATARQTQVGLDALRASAEKVLEVVASGQGSGVRSQGSGVRSQGAGAAASNGNGQHNGVAGEKHNNAGVQDMGVDLLATSHYPLATIESVLAYLTQWQESGAPEDCSLPELYRQARQAAPELSIGAFHDILRRLHDEQRIYLHPWTGPLYDMPEPAYALLAGHQIAYYASIRTHHAER